MTYSIDKFEPLEPRELYLKLLVNALESIAKDRLRVSLSGIPPNISGLYWVHTPVFVERWEWLYNTSELAKKYEFYRKYMGRTGSVWKSEYDKLDYTEWSLPLIETGANTQQPSPWDNAIHLRNSKDGSALDQVYISPRIVMKPPVELNWDMYLPALITDNFPSGTSIYIGFEINSGFYLGTGYAFCIFNDGSGVTTTLRAVGLIDLDGSSGVISSNDLSDNLVTGEWKSYKLVLTKRKMILYQSTTAGQGYPLAKIGELDIALDEIAWVTPFFANESDVIVSGVKIGQFQVQELRNMEFTEKIIDVSSISAGGYTDSPVLRLSRSVAVTVRVTYNASATKGIRVYILACTDKDCSNIDSVTTDDAFTYFEPSFSAGATRQKTVNIDMLPKYVKIRVVNLDNSYATGTVKVWVHEVI